jgi:hypothetical protein
VTLATRAQTSVADLVCLSHLRWDFVYQRPNHLMSRAARGRRVYFIEEAERRGTTPRVEAVNLDGITIVRPVLPEGASEPAATLMLREEIDRFLASEGVARPWLWYYTPMALPWTAHIDAEAVVYDCMDELAGFKFAPPILRELEQRLISRADVVFTGGRSLYEAKRGRHLNTFLFPSSVDGAHFAQARHAADPADQATIGRPRVGYFGVIDERIDLELIGQIAHAGPDWQMVMVGPLAKIGEDDLPRAANIHWLGAKSYADLPAYLGGWDVAIMPFALNDSTRHISPTKTPEYLSGGRPVVSTAIHDVVHPYGDEGLVAIADGGAAFVEAIERALHVDREELIAHADRFLATQSWDATWSQMEQLVNELRPQTRSAPLAAPTFRDARPVVGARGRGVEAPVAAPLSRPR